MIVIPHLDMVVTVLAGFYDDSESSWIPEQILMQAIIPAIHRDANDPARPQPIEAASSQADRHD